MLSNEIIEQFAKAWYRKLDVHAPQVELLPLLADKDLEMVFPEATVYGWAGFESWYQRVIRIFFDEVHTVQSVQSEINGNEATVKVVVRWEASVWNPPSPESARIILDAYQTWIVVLQNEMPVVKKYIVDSIEYQEGSAKL